MNWLALLESIAEELPTTGPSVLLCLVGSAACPLESMPGRAAISAVHALKGNSKLISLDAWKNALSRETASPNSRSKGCPKSAFLGLCAQGLIYGVQGEVKDADLSNALYVVEALRVLRKTPALADSPIDLWNAWASTKPDRPANHNQQMTVLVALWKAGLIS